MHYCDINFKNKKALKNAVAIRKQFPDKAPPVTVYNPEVFSGERPTPRDGTVCVGGPHYPAPHTWYATVTIVAGEVVAVK